MYWSFDPWQSEQLVEHSSRNVHWKTNIDQFVVSFLCLPTLITIEQETQETCIVFRATSSERWIVFLPVSAFPLCSTTSQLLRKVRQTYYDNANATPLARCELHKVMSKSTNFNKRIAKILLLRLSGEMLNMLVAECPLFPSKVLGREGRWVNHSTNYSCFHF